jgi:biotin transporter BioY
MTLLLAFLIAVVLVGLFSDKLNARMYALILLGAAGVTFLYYATTRFMT